MADHPGLGSSPVTRPRSGCLWVQGMSCMIPEGTKEARARTRLDTARKGSFHCGYLSVFIAQGTNWGQDVIGKSQTHSHEGSCAAPIGRVCPGGTLSVPVEPCLSREALLGRRTGRSSLRSLSVLSLFLSYFCALRY